MIEYFVIFIANFLLGYFIGRGGKPEEVFRKTRQFGRVVTRQIEGGVGIVKRPSASRLKKIKGKESEQSTALKDTFDNIPELRVIRRK